MQIWSLRRAFRNRCSAGMLMTASPSQLTDRMRILRGRSPECGITACYPLDEPSDDGHHRQGRTSCSPSPQPSPLGRGSPARPDVHPGRRSSDSLCPGLLSLAPPGHLTGEVPTALAAPINDIGTGAARVRLPWGIRNAEHSSAQGGFVRLGSGSSFGRCRFPAVMHPKPIGGILANRFFKGFVDVEHDVRGGACLAVYDGGNFGTHFKPPST